MIAKILSTEISQIASRATAIASAADRGGGRFRIRDAGATPDHIATAINKADAGLVHRYVEPGEQRQFFMDHLGLL